MKLSKRVKPGLLFTLCMILCFCCSGIRAQDLQADNMLLFQRGNGGWFKQFHGKAFSYNINFTDAQKNEIAKEVQQGEATIDNNATTKEIKYLVKAYKKYKNPAYLAAAEKGIRYLLKAQYPNGGWPQYYPDTNLYRAEITFNDNAMVNVLKLMQDVTAGRSDFDVVNASFKEPCQDAIERGVDCILKTQIRVDGKLTAWCQQYDQHSLQPAKARSYELPCISGSESVYIVEFLMSLSNPSKEIKQAIVAADQWLKQVQIQGYKFVNVPAPGTPEGYDRQLVADANSTVWARYYEIGTNKPFFCSRDGIKKYAVTEISYERRNGYGWYGVWPKKLLEREYPQWKERIGK